MYVIEPKKIHEALKVDGHVVAGPIGWRMVCRSLANSKLAIPVSEIHATSDAARRDPVAVAWAKYIPAIGIGAVEALQWAWELVEKKPGLKMGMPQDVMESYREHHSLPPAKSRGE